MSSEVRIGTIFISHASPDLDKATEIYLRLKDQDYPVWMAVHEVKPGANYAEIIFKTLDASKAVIVLLSTSSIASDHVKREVSLARELSIPIHAVALSDLVIQDGAFSHEWSTWIKPSDIKTFRDVREAAKFLIKSLSSEFDKSSQRSGLDKGTLLWIENASVLLKTLISISDSDFDFIAFDREMHTILGYQVEQLTKELNNEGRGIVGEFLYSCYWTFTSLRPNWVPDDSRHQQTLLSGYLIPASMNFKHPEAMNSLAFKLLNQDIDTFITWIEENYDFESVIERSLDVEARTPLENVEDIAGARESNAFGFLTYSAGLRLFAAFYQYRTSQQKLDEALDWLKRFEEEAENKDLEYLREICPTPAIRIWYPMVILFSAFFFHVSGSEAKARKVITKLSDKNKEEFKNMSITQAQNLETAEEYRKSWSALEAMLTHFGSAD